MLNLESQSSLHLAGITFTLNEGGASGAPAVITPFDPDSDRYLHEDAEEGWQCQ